MIWIRTTSGDRYRPYEWAHLFNIQYDKQGTDLWVVEYQDGETDVWPASDTGAGYDICIQIEPPEDSSWPSRPHASAAGKSSSPPATK